MRQKHPLPVVRPYQEKGFDGLEDKPSAPPKVWNRVPEQRRDQILELALGEPDLPPREIAVKFTDQRGYYVSESTVYRILKENDLITSPEFILMKAADRFQNSTTAPNQLWQTDFTYFKVIGWGWPQSQRQRPPAALKHAGFRDNVGTIGDVHRWLLRSHV